VNLRELAARVPGTALSGEGETAIASVTYDSRKAGPGALFVAIKGLAADGNQFVDAARKKGAAAVASERPAQPGSPWLQVPDAREALARLSAAVLGEPAKSLELIGVTGTNGKTTTTYLVDAALRAAGHKVGLLGTVQYRIGDRLADATRTTPEASDLQGLLREMVDAGCSHAVLEVSSHSLELKRVAATEFRVAVFTNLTRDHLDFHGDMDSYFQAKRKLFAELVRPDGRSVINADDDRAADLIAASRAPVWTYGIDQPADFRAEDVRLALDGTRFCASRTCSPPSRRRWRPASRPTSPCAVWPP
jgi:UDP-N-acetylmuramoyl-L-alanyl-D-glutamate--2,6-diaminopimelate ligase